VLVGHGGESVVQAEDGALHRCLTRRRTGRAVCGDSVEWRPETAGTGIIERILPRRNELTRTNYRGKARVLAANLDCLMAVIAPEPKPDPELVDRYLVVAHSLDVEALVILNKRDLLDAEEDMEDALLSPWQGLGHPTIGVSSLRGDGLDGLRQWIGARTGILVGQSGVGKSSLINVMVPDRSARTRALSEASGLGRHTTTETTLYDLPGGGALIDSPGIRILRLGHLSPDSIALGFRDFQPYLGRCRYRDCSHREEPGCAIVEASRRGLIDQRRLASYHALLAECRGFAAG